MTTPDLHPDSPSANAVDDLVLLGRVAEGDRDAFRRLYSHYHRRLHRFLMRLTRERQLTEEVINDTMMVVWQHAADFRGALKGRPQGLSGYLKHQGLYAYRPETLVRLTQLPPSPLEIDEGLEQLRALQAGIGILVLPSDFRSIAVDTPADLERAQSKLQETRR